MKEHRVLLSIKNAKLLIGTKLRIAESRSDTPVGFIGGRPFTFGFDERFTFWLIDHGGDIMPIIHKDILKKNKYIIDLGPL